MTEDVLLPRGTHASHTAGAPVATARWASPAEIEAYRYKGDGDIYLGVINGPSPEALPILERLGALQKTIIEAKFLRLDSKRTQIVAIGRLRDALMRTVRIPIGIKDDRHQIIFAGTRSGKGVSSVIPNLLLYPGSVMAIDPKGSNARATAARRGKGSRHARGIGQKVYVLDPYRVSRVDESLLATFNPLAAHFSDDDAVIEGASSIAEALISTSSSGDSKHFEETARILLKAIILFVLLNEKELKNRTLPYVYRLAMRGVRGMADPIKVDGEGEIDPFRAFLSLMEQEERLEGVVSGIAATVLDMGDREYGSVLSTLRRNIEFLERPAMRRVLSSSSFTMDEFKTDPKGITVYLCLPVTRFEDCGRWLRLMVACGLESIYAHPEPPKCGHPVLMVLEEFATLGHMATIETAAGYAAEFGLKLYFVLQDLSQLKKHYEKSWETFLANASVIQGFGLSDATTLNYFSKKLGETEVLQTTESNTTSISASSNDIGDLNLFSTLMQNRGFLSIISPLMLFADRAAKGHTTTTNVAINNQVQRTPLLLPDEVERAFARERMTSIVAIKGERPFALVREAYHSAPEFLGLFEPDREPFNTIEEAAALKVRHEKERQDQTSALIAEAESFAQSLGQAVEAAREQAARQR